MMLAATAAVAAAQPASAAWREASTAHFVIYSEQRPRELEEFATHLEKFDAAMRLLRKLPDEPIGKANRVTVFVLSDAGLVQKLYGEGARRNGSEVRGFYIPRAEGSVAFVPRPNGDSRPFDLSGETVLLHEYAHHFMLQNFPGAYPTWFIEGFAEFYSATSFDKDGGVGVGKLATHRAGELLHARPLPVEKLVAVTRARIGSDEGREIYARGWLLVHYLIMEPGRSGQLNDYLTRVARGEKSVDAARAAFGDLKTLDRDLDHYLNTRFFYLRIRPDELATPKVQVRELSRAENAVMPIQIRLERGLDRAQAEELVPAIRAAAATYPTDSAAQNVFAEGEYDAGHYAEAEAAADRALAADPKSIHALLFKARSEMALARAAHDRSEARWAAIRKLIVTANHVDTDDPRPPIWFFRSFLAQGLKPTANAAAGLVGALSLAPQDAGLRMTVAHRYLVDGKAREARATLAPIAFNPHGGEAAEIAARAIAVLDSGAGTQAALAAWNGPAGDEPDAAGDALKKNGGK
jgi:tetratricopeptide (TPR) repeat protein